MTESVNNIEENFRKFFDSAELDLKLTNYLRRKKITKEIIRKAIEEEIHVWINKKR